MSEAYDQRLERPRLAYLDETIGDDEKGHYSLGEMDIDPASIWGCKQNHPELVVQDLSEEFGLDEKQKLFVRLSLMRRGVNKWLYARRQFIELKHEVKSRMKAEEEGSKQYKLLQELNEKMQHIAKTPRWVEWPTKVHSCRQKDEEEVVIRGKMY